MNNITWPGGFEDFRHKVRLYANKIANGTLVAMDPASGGSSMPGFALFYRGELHTSGTIEMTKKSSIQERLSIIYQKVGQITPIPIDVLSIELIRGRNTHVHLQWAIGVTVAAAQAPILIECPIRVWKAMADATEGYEKGDEADATMIGKAVIKLAREALSEYSAVLPGKSNT